MKLIAKKPCSFGGKKFYIGDEVPAELVVNPLAQEAMGVLVRVNEQGEAIAKPASEVVTTLVKMPVSVVTIDIHTEEGDLPLELTPEALQSVFDVLTSSAENAVPIIEEMTDDDALILLHMADSRKSVKKAAESRAKAINEPETQDEPEAEGEQPADTEESAGEQ